MRKQDSELQRKTSAKTHVGSPQDDGHGAVGNAGDVSDAITDGSQELGAGGTALELVQQDLIHTWASGRIFESSAHIMSKVLYYFLYGFESLFCTWA